MMKVPFNQLNREILRRILEGNRIVVTDRKGAAKFAIVPISDLNLMDAQLLDDLEGDDNRFDVSSILDKL